MSDVTHACTLAVRPPEVACCAELGSDAFWHVENAALLLLPRHVCAEILLKHSSALDNAVQVRNKPAMHMVAAVEAAAATSCV